MGLGGARMIEVQCPSCHTRYRIDEQVLPEGLPTFKCSRCGHVFRFEPRKSRFSAPADRAAAKHDPAAEPDREPLADVASQFEDTEPQPSRAARNSDTESAPSSPDSTAVRAPDRKDTARTDIGDSYLQAQSLKSQRPAERSQQSAP